jgi:alginate O-acetyltransferase complex protein AlgI
MVFLCIFLPIVFALHLVLPGIRAKNAMIVIASIVFYAYGEPVYVILLIGSSLLNYICALFVGKSGKYKKAALVFAVAGNLAFLIIFKYTGFIVDSVNTVFHLSIAAPEIRMPIGISFFTFQAISYVIDVYR